MIYDHTHVPTLQIYRRKKTNTKNILSKCSIIISNIEVTDNEMIFNNYLSMLLDIFKTMIKRLIELNEKHRTDTMIYYKLYRSIEYSDLSISQYFQSSFIIKTTNIYGVLLGLIQNQKIGICNDQRYYNNTRPIDPNDWFVSELIIYFCKVDSVLSTDNLETYDTLINRLCNNLTSSSYGLNGYKLKPQKNIYIVE